MTVSNRSWTLLVCSTGTPITIVAFRIASLDQRRAIAAAAKSVTGTLGGLLPDLIFFGGILCLLGYLFSLVFDYRNSRQKTWLP